MIDVKRLKKILPVLAAVLLLALVWGTGLRDSQYAWDDLAIDRAVYGMEFRDGRLAHDAAAGDAYGALSAGPYLDLPAGNYRLRFLAETDADNRVGIVSANGAAIEPAEIIIPADSWMMETEIALREDAEDLQIVFHFENGTRFAVHTLKLIGPAYTDRAWLITFAVLAALVLYGLWMRGWMTADRAMTLCVLGVAVALASMPALKADLSLGYDSTFHLARLRNLVSAWEEGQFPARVGGFTYNGYGAATSAMYPDLFLWLPGLMLMSGASIQLAMHTLIVGVNIVTAATMYALAKRLFGRRAAVCAAVLYTLATYRLSDLYPRAALGEALGMAFVPLFLLGLYEVLARDRRRWPLLVLGATCVFESHMLTTGLCALAAVGFGICCLPRVICEKRFGAIAKAIVMTALVNLFFLVPFLTLGATGLGETAPTGNCAKAALAPAQLLLGMFVPDVPQAWRFEAYHLKDFPVEIGLPLLAGVLLALHECLSRGKTQKKRRVLGLILLGGAAALLCTTLSPWSALSSLTGGLSDVIQFPWRLLMVVDVCFALAAGWGFSLLDTQDRQVSCVAALALAAICAMPMLAQETLSLDYLRYGETVSSQIVYDDYTLPGTDIDDTLQKGIVSTGDVLLGEPIKTGTTLRVDVNAQSDAVLTLPLFAYDGYAAQIDGEAAALGVGENNRLTVMLPAGTQGELHVGYAGSPLWRIADGISLAALIGMAVFGILCRKNVKKIRDKN